MFLSLLNYGTTYVEFNHILFANCMSSILRRCSDHARDEVVPACQVTLKNLQLDYLDLYLVHAPITMAKGKTVRTATEADKLGYSQEGEAKCWEVMMNED